MKLTRRHFIRAAAAALASASATAHIASYEIQLEQADHAGYGLR